MNATRALWVSLLVLTSCGDKPTLCGWVYVETMSEPYCELPAEVEVWSVAPGQAACVGFDWQGERVATLRLSAEDTFELDLEPGEYGLYYADEMGCEGCSAETVGEGECAAGNLEIYLLMVGEG